MKYFILILLTFTLACSNEKEQADNNLKLEKCPCDTVLYSAKNSNNRDTMDCYIGTKSKVSLAYWPNNDTIKVTRYYTEDDTWHVQEYIIVSKDKIVDPEYAMYCSFKDSSDYYNLSFIEDETLKRGEDDFVLKEFLGLDAVIDGDTLKSKTNSISIPKSKFKGRVQLLKNLSGTYKGEQGIMNPSIYVIAEELIKYGSVHEQYKLINKLCR